MSKSQPSSFLRNLALVSFALFVVSLLVAPLTSLLSDTVYCFLPWARASSGVSPTDIYAQRADCNYPPFFLYVLTAIERGRLVFGFAPTSTGAMILLKTPVILAHVGGVWLCGLGLRKPFGESVATRSAIAYAACVPLFVDGAVWGQVDTVLCVLLVGSALAVLHERFIIAGVLAGLALALKLQAIVALPFLFLYLVRRYGAGKTAIATAAGLSAWFLILLPFIAQGGVVTARMLTSYTGAVGVFPVRSLGAYNIWYLTVAFDRVVRHLPVEIANSDAVPMIGGLTGKMIGLGLFGSAIVLLLVALWRRPTFSVCVQAIALGYVAFYLLTTQQHERYILPGIAFFALGVGWNPVTLRRYVGWCFANTGNLVNVLILNNRVLLGTEHTAPGHSLIRLGSFLLCFLYIGLAIASVGGFVAELTQHPPVTTDEGTPPE